MRLGFNALDADPQYVGGVNTYLFGLLDGLVKTRGQNEIIIFANSYNAKMFSHYKNLEGCSVIEISGERNIFKRVLRRIVYFTFTPLFVEWASNVIFQKISSIIESKVDLVYFPTTVMFPYRYKIPTWVSMHDIQHEHFPHFFSWRERLSRWIVFGLTAKNATKIQASTEFIKSDLKSHYPSLKDSQIIVIPEGVDLDSFQQGSKESVKVKVIEKYKLPKKFLFFPGQLWPHKNHITVLRALKYLRDKEHLEIPLVMTGAKFQAAENIFKFIDEQKMRSVFYLGKIPFEDLKALYHEAFYLITGVLYESSSLPILEAAASGLPVIASKVGSNLEMSKNFHLNLFEPLDEVALAILIKSLWSSDGLRSEQVKYNLNAIREFSWNKIAERYWESFKSNI